MSMNGGLSYEPGSGPTTFRSIDAPHDVLSALSTILRYIAIGITGAVTEQVKGTEGPRYYDAKTSPMGRRAFLRMARAGAFPTFKAGKRLVARCADVHAAIEAQQGARLPGPLPRRAAEAPPVDLNALSSEELHEHAMGRPSPAKRAAGKRLK